MPDTFGGSENSMLLFCTHILKGETGGRVFPKDFGGAVRPEP